MKKTSVLMLALALSVVPLRAQDPPAAPATEEIAILETTLGSMTIRFHEKDAPRTVEAFKALVREGFYDGKPFYRVVKGHVIQTGDGGESDRPTVPDEFNANLHVPGALGLAHGQEPNSGSTEIYLCLAPRPHLDGRFTVFGQVIEGLDILQAIGNVPVNEKFLDGGVAFHEPKEPVILKKVRLETRPAAGYQSVP